MGLRMSMMWTISGSPSCSDAWRASRSAGSGSSPTIWYPSRTFTPTITSGCSRARAMACAGEAQRRSSSSPVSAVIIPWTATWRKASIRVCARSMT